MNLLQDLIETHGTELWLINTGWLGPNVPGRKRVDILVSKAIINAVRDAKIDMAEDNFWYDPVFKLQVPKTIPGVASDVLDPRAAWTDKAAYAKTADKLAGIFQDAIRRLPGIPDTILEAGPKALP